MNYGYNPSMGGPGNGGSLTLEELERQMLQQSNAPQQMNRNIPASLPTINTPGVLPSVWSWNGGGGWGADINLPTQAPNQIFHQPPQSSSGSLPQLPPLERNNEAFRNPPLSSLPNLPLLFPSTQNQPQSPFLSHGMISSRQYVGVAPLPQFPQQSPQLSHQSNYPPQAFNDSSKSQMPPPFRLAQPPIPLNPSQPTVDEMETNLGKRSPAKKIEHNVKSELRARFEWRAVGSLDVRPTVAGPDEYIDVSWEIPAKYLSKDSLIAAAGSNQRKNPAPANNNRDDTQQGDWIGLFRARQRIDDSTGFILTREVNGRANYDPKTDTVRGRVRLRAPRGVGTYDFRYFSSGGQPNNSETSNDKVDNLLRFPLARSSALVVEVQGAALYEALQFVEKNVKDKKRLAAAAQQFSTLIRQVKTLRSPLQNSSIKPDDQERRLLEEIWRAITLCIERGVQLDEVLVQQVNELQTKATKARADFEELNKTSADGSSKEEVEFEDDLVDQDMDDNASPSEPNRKDESADPAEQMRKSKRQIWAMIRRDVAQTERDRASVGSAIRGVIDDVRTNPYLFSLLADQRRRYLVSFIRRYSPTEEHFFQSEADLRDYSRKELMICRWGLNEDGRIEIEHNRAGLFDTAINNLMPNLLPGPQFFEERRTVIRRLQALLDEEFAPVYGACRLAPFGSSANSFGGPKSDLDLCLVLLDRPLESAQHGAAAVELVAKILNMHGFKEVDDSRKTARIPIVQFLDPIFNIECDICVNNPLAIRNTLLLRTYGSVDDRARQMVFVVKLWAKRRGLNDPSTHTLSSYGWILLAINYLQRIGLLPVLQEMPVKISEEPGGVFFPHVPCAGADGRVHDTYFFGDPESSFFSTPEAKERAAFEARRKPSNFPAGVAQLLSGFFWDLAMNDWRRNVASIKTGDFVLKATKAAEDSWRLHPRCAIEDPFETSYDVGHVLRDSTFKRIRVEAARAYALLVGCCEGFVDSPVEPCLEELLKEVEE